MEWFNNFVSRIKNFWNSRRSASIAILIAIGVFIIASIVIPVTIISINKTKQKNIEKTKTETQQEMIGSLFAPFSDLTQWTSMESGYSNNGVINLSKIADETKINCFHLGFINPDQTQPLEDNGTIRWGWGGYSDLSEAGNDGYQYEGIKKTINDLKKNGINYIISFGGQAGRSPWTVTQNVNKLAEMYEDVISTYGCLRIDMDIEMSNQSESNNRANAKAIKIVQDNTGIDVSLTIPIMPYGWSDTQIAIIDAYLSEGVDLVLINSMTMCYGSGALYANEDYGDASIRAIENAKNQIIEIYNYFGKNISEAEAYKKLGSTVAIGYESGYPIFTPQMMEKVSIDAKNKGLGMLSFWSINRDCLAENNLGVLDLYAFVSNVSSYVK